MTNFEMPGLRADNPQGWMAAVGLLFILDHQDKKVQLSWQHLTPILHGISEQEVMETVAEYLQTGSHAIARLSDIPRDLQKDKIALDFTAGKVNFSNVIEHMIKTVNEKQILSTLTEPWKNADHEVSLGWDPLSVKQAATLAGEKAPDSAKHRTQLGGQWLAAESLLIICPSPDKLNHAFHWVTWQVPLDLEGVYSIVQAQTEAWNGVHYCSNIGFSGSFKFFLPALQQK